jgi:hypothetical protein
VVQELLADVERLIADVVELQNDGIRLPALNARMRREVLDQRERAFPSRRRLTSAAWSMYRRRLAR